MSEGITRNTSILLGLAIVLLPLAEGRPLVASVLFTAFGLTDAIAANIKNISYGINAAADYYSVITRIQNLLKIEEKQQSPQSDQLPTPIRLVA